MKALPSIIVLRVFLLMTALTSSVSIAAQESLTKPLISRFIQVTQKIAALPNPPSELISPGETKVKNKKKAIRALKASKRYPEIKALLGEYEISSLEELFEISERILGIVGVNKMNGPYGIQLIQTEKILKINLFTMKANNGSEQLVEKTEDALEQVQSQIKAIQKSLINVSDQDKEFLQKNLQWLKLNKIIE